MAEQSTIKDIESFTQGVEVGYELNEMIRKEFNSYFYAGKKWGWIKKSSST